MSYYQQEEQPVRNQRVSMSDRRLLAGEFLPDGAVAHDGGNGRKCCDHHACPAGMRSSADTAVKQYNLRKDQTRTEYKSFCMAYDKYAES